MKSFEDVFNETLSEHQHSWCALHDVYTKAAKIYAEQAKEDIDRLMMPRYEVIADYPGNPQIDCPFAIGEIIELRKYPHNRDVWGFERNNLTGIWDEAYLKKYPHLFQKMNWWERRDITEMPQYVKHMELNTIDKVSDHFVEDGLWLRKDDGFIFPYATVLPATRAEYLEYKKGEDMRS